MFKLWNYRKVYQINRFNKSLNWKMNRMKIKFQNKNRYHHYHWFSSVQLLSRVRLLATPWIAACQASLSITNSQSLLKLMSIKSVMPSKHLILCHPLLLLPQTPPSIRVFSNESTSHEVAKVLEFQLQHQSFQWTPRTDL